MFYYVGFNGPYILAFLNILVMIKSWQYLIPYIISLYLNKIINHYLKTTIKEPRPDEKYTVRTSFDRGHPDGSKSYGMPSGHSQLIFFTIFYTWFVSKKKDILIMELFFSLITIYQRWKFKRHSIPQLFAGFVVGGLLAFFVYFITKKLLEKNIFNVYPSKSPSGRGGV